MQSRASAITSTAGKQKRLLRSFAFLLLASLLVLSSSSFAMHVARISGHHAVSKSRDAATLQVPDQPDLFWFFAGECLSQEEEVDCDFRKSTFTKCISDFHACSGVHFFLFPLNLVFKQESVALKSAPDALFIAYRNLRI
jgi:hypothetical protein